MIMTTAKTATVMMMASVLKAFGRSISSAGSRANSTSLRFAKLVVLEVKYAVEERILSISGHSTTRLFRKESSNHPTDVHTHDHPTGRNNSTTDCTDSRRRASCNARIPTSKIPHISFPSPWKITSAVAIWKN